MFRHILFGLWLIGSACSAFSTPQAPDYLVVKGDTFRFHSYPLEALPAKATYVGAMMPFSHTGCWRGYICYWQLSDQKLYLTGIISCSFDRKDTVSLATVFGDQYKDGKVAADWFTGELVCAHGKLIRYFGDHSIYQFETVYQCSQGRITGQETFDNRQTTVSIYETEPEELRRFIYRNIDWNSLPILPADSTVRVFVKVKGNASGNSPNVTLVKSAGSVWDKEALRVVGMLPTWSAIYERGKLQSFAWNFPVLFSAANRRRYSQ